jgi:hypothetical protein
MISFACLVLLCLFASGMSRTLVIDQILSVASGSRSHLSFCVLLGFKESCCHLHEGGSQQV